VTRVCVVDYGMGNVSSVISAFERIGVTCAPLDNPTGIGGSSHIVLPGVGAFGPAMKRLEEQGWVSEISRYVKGGGALLGICLGMQVLAMESLEGVSLRPLSLELTEPSASDVLAVPSFQSSIPGLGLIPGVVRSLKSFGSVGRLPHIGWNSVHVVGSPPLFAGLQGDLDMYFVHSFGLEVVSPLTIATTNYGCEFSAAVQCDNVIGTQFHPEKSSQYGLRLLKNFVSMG